MDYPVSMERLPGAQGRCHRHPEAPPGLPRHARIRRAEGCGHFLAGMCAVVACLSDCLKHRLLLQACTCLRGCVNMLL
jgi:hypothetical protein